MILTSEIAEKYGIFYKRKKTEHCLSKMTFRGQENILLDMDQNEEKYISKE